MKIISIPIKKSTILKRHNSFFKTMIKAIVDVEREVIALDAELHADLENMLLHEGSKQEHLWGINLFLEKAQGDWIDYTALINIRPSMDNRSMEVEDPKLRHKITNIVKRLIVDEVIRSV
jgi:hypothetical protein